MNNNLTAILEDAINILACTSGYQQNLSVDQLHNQPMISTGSKAANIIKEHHEKRREFLGKVNGTHVKTTASMWYFLTHTEEAKMQEVHIILPLL